MRHSRNLANFRHQPPRPYVRSPKIALATLTAAYTQAVKEYTRTNQDVLATATEKELAVLRAEAGFPSIAGVWQEGPEENQIRVVITQNDDKFTAACTYQHKEHGKIRWVMTGTISKDGEVKGIFDIPKRHAAG